MLRKTLLAATLLCGSAFAAEPTIVEDAEDLEQPGIIQFHGVTVQDEVRVDGELVPAEGLARTRYNLLVAPGEYVVSVRLAGSSRECVNRVTVETGARVRPPCLSQPAGMIAD